LAFAVGAVAPALAAVVSVLALRGIGPARRACLPLAEAPVLLVE